MKWFDKWFRNKCKEAWESVNDEDEDCDSNVGAKRPRAKKLIGIPNQTDVRTPGTNGLHFILYPANGGNVLEVRSFNEKTGDNYVSLHLISSEQDLGESIGKIITIEALRR